MARKQLVIKVRPDGTVNAETLNMKGQECLDYIAVLEDLLDAQTVTSSYTEDYTAIESSVTGETTDHALDKG